MTRKQIEAAADRAGWNCKIERRKKDSIRKKDYWYVCFTTDTHFGQDVCYEYEVETLDKIVDEVYESWQGYDPDDEAVMWYGKNGAPKSLRDLLSDMDEVDDALERLYTVLSGGKLPEEKPISYKEKADNLRSECLMELTSFSHNAKPNPFGYDAKGYANPDKCSKYEWIICLYGKWVLLDGSGYQYSIECMPLEEFCEMVDGILNGKE